MSSVEITLKSGNVIIADASEFSVQRNALLGIVGVKWKTPEEAERALMHIDVDQIAAVVFVDEKKEAPTT